MKSLISVFVLGLVLSCCSAAFLNPGKEYVYSYDATVGAGSSDYVQFGSVFNVTGIVRVQRVDAGLISVKLDDLSFAAYNGKYDYFSRPLTTPKAYQQLNPLTEPFQIKKDSNQLVESIVLSKDIPEWARNIQRGIASLIQLSSAVAGQETNFVVDEKTISGECPTLYQVVKSTEGVEIRKQRNHAKCANRVIQIRKPGTAVQSCVEDNTRDVYNSSAYAVYNIGDFNGETAMKSLIGGGSVMYSIFGPKGHSQYTWTMSMSTLQDIKSSGFNRIPAPSNPENFDNLRYVFESKFSADDSLEEPRPYFFHQSQPITDEATLKTISNRVYENIKSLADSLETTKVYEDLTEFHKVTPFAVIPDISALPYGHLKTLNARVKQDNKYTTTKLFLDALVISGTGPAALLIRDIVGSTTETRTIGNLIGTLPHYVRNPTEKLLVEYESLIKPDLPKHNLRIIEFAFASLISRTCSLYDCKLGFVDKYVNYFSNKYDTGATFEDKTAAVQALRNLGLGGSNAKLLAIVADTNAERSIRTAAMGGLRSVTPEQAAETLLPIFYNRQNHHELRCKAAMTYLIFYYDETVAQQMVLSLWSDRCKYTKNFLYTFFEGLAFSTRPCLKNKGSHARSILNIFPPWTVDRTLSVNYIRDYNDPEFNFGHMTHLSIHKNGDSVLPTTIFGSLNGHIAGYGASYFSFFIRLEGVGKAIADRIMSMSTGQINFDEVKQVFSKIGVQDRTATPLKIELSFMLHNRVIAYHAADASTVTTIPTLLKKLQEMKSTYEVELSRMVLLGGVTVEQPSEFGTPVSVISSITALANVNIKTNREKAGTSISQTSEWHMQGGLFGISKSSAHFPAFGTMHSVTAHRTFRSRMPRKVSLNFDYKALSLNFAFDTPTKEDPAVAMVHATADTSISSDTQAVTDTAAAEFLKASCPACTPVATISKGAEHRGTRQIGLLEVSKYKIFEGVKRGAKYFDCEKPHTRYDTIKRLTKFFSQENKNSGKLTIVKLLLAIQHARDFLFLSPVTQTCGIKLYYHRDPEARSIFEKVEASFRVKYTADPNKKLGTKIQFKGAVNFKHGGADPQTRTVDVNGQVAISGLDKSDVKLRFLAKDEATKKNVVLCVEANTQLKKPVDFLSYEGDNEPGFERKITLKWGDEPPTKDACPENAAYIKSSRKSQRSQEQIDESNSDSWPFKNCKDQKGSAHWPGQVTPLTHECLQAAVDQTNLRESNITIEYQVDVEARNRWKKPAVLFAALLLPYWDTERSTAAAHAHSTHVETRGDSQYVKGKVEIDVSARKVNPSLDIHWHASHGDEHFHNVDLAAIPGPLKIKPVFSRFSPFFYEMFKLGVFGYCSSSVASVITFDNFTYHAGLTECPTLLAGDCDDKPRYAILTRKIGADKVGLTVYLGEHKLELNDLNTVTVDGKSHPASDIVYTDEDEEKLFKFVKINPTYVGIISEKLSLYIGYTGVAASVTAGSRYRATSCGLCGNFDSNPYNDFVGPDNTCKGLDAEGMVKAYTVRDGKCARVGSVCPV